MLVAVNVILVGSLLALAINGTQADAILATAGKENNTTAIDIQVPTVASNLDVIQSQPIFHITRSFYVPPDPTTVVVQTPPPDYRLVGVMTLPNRPINAFLVNGQTGVRSRVQKGDTLEGWTVEDVSNQRVALSLDGRHAEIGTAKLSPGAPGMQVAGSQPGAMMPTLPIVPMLPTAQGGLRILSAGPGRVNSAQGLSNSTPSRLPPAPPGGVGARLYRPPPSE
jgi:hypothetical protein